MLNDLRYALRTLLKSPGFTVISLLTLALGIGVNTSMFSLLNTLLFATAPFPRAESIVALNGQTPEAEFINFSALEIEDLRNHSTQTFTALAPMSGTMESVSLPDQLPEQTQGTAAQADLFKVLETQPLLGRFFTADECVAGRDTVVLITEEMWRKKFAARPDVLGQTLRISGRIFTIIGVLPKAYSAPFVFGEGQYFRPLVFSKEQQEGRGRREAALLLRLASGVALPQALASLAPVSERWVKENRRLYPNYHFRVQLAGRVGGSANVAIIFLQLGLAAAILALACANLANLQMARAAARLRDLAIRSALGATRWMLIKQQLLESLVLSVAGGALGLLIADWSNQLIGRNIRLGLTSTLEMTIDGRVLGFTAAISILAGLGFGLGFATVEDPVGSTVQSGKDAIRAFYAQADLFVLASFAEGIPVVLMEAMSMEIPCLATWITRIPELIRHGVASHGLWTLSRGLARGCQRYFASLAAADRGRRNDLDGRGNLSDAGLAAHCQFFLETMLDQIQFMSDLLDLPARLVGAGMAIGLVLAAVAVRPLSMFLVPGVRPTDATNFVVVALALSLVAALATVAPTLRALRIDPAVALRHE